TRLRAERFKEREAGSDTAARCQIPARLPAGLELSDHLPPGLAVGDRTPLVAQFLAAADRDLRLHAPVPEVEPGRDEREALLAYLAVQAVDLPAVEEQLPRPVRVVVGAVSLPVLRNVQPDEPRLAVPNLGVGLLQGRLAVAQ